MNKFEILLFIGLGTFTASLIVGSLVKENDWAWILWIVIGLGIIATVVGGLGAAISEA